MMLTATLVGLFGAHVRDDGSVTLPTNGGQSDQAIVGVSNASGAR